MATEVEWRPVPGYPHFIVSSTGRIKRVAANRNTQWIGHEKAPSITPDGYLYVNFAGRRCFVNRIVCHAFHGDPPSPKHHAAHNDGNPQNNCASNLRWATVKENMADQYRHGTRIHRKGEENPCHKLTEADVREIKRLMREGARNVPLAKLYGVGRHTIGDIRRGKLWRHLI